MGAFEAFTFLTLLALSTFGGCRADSGAAPASGDVPQLGDEHREFFTPEALVGDCETIWTSHLDNYKLPYTVHFEPTGSFSWIAPFAHKAGAENGVGVYLSPTVVSKAGSRGEFEAHHFSATRFLPGGTTTCCCEYVGSAGEGSPLVLSDYCRAWEPGRAGESMVDVCTPYMKQEPCPPDNATAALQLGAPFIEVYARCAPGNSSARAGPGGSASAAASEALSLGGGSDSSSSGAVRGRASQQRLAAPPPPGRGAARSPGVTPVFKALIGTTAAVAALAAGAMASFWAQRVGHCGAGEGDRYYLVSG